MLACMVLHIYMQVYQHLLWIFYFVFIPTIRFTLTSSRSIRSFCHYRTEFLSSLTWCISTCYISWSIKFICNVVMMVIFEWLSIYFFIDINVNFSIDFTVQLTYFKFRSAFIFGSVFTNNIFFMSFILIPVIQ